MQWNSHHSQPGVTNNAKCSHQMQQLLRTLGPHTTSGNLVAEQRGYGLPNQRWPNDTYIYSNIQYYKVVRISSSFFKHLETNILNISKYTKSMEIWWPWQQNSWISATPSRCSGTTRASQLATFTAARLAWIWIIPNWIVPTARDEPSPALDRSVATKLKLWPKEAAGAPELPITLLLGMEQNGTQLLQGTGWDMYQMCFMY